MATETEKAKVDYAILPGQDDEGKPIFSLLVKRTYDIKPGLALARADKDEKLRPLDEYYDMGDPQTSTVKYESDLVPFKSHTDVVFIGKAYAPGGVPVTVMDVGIQVEGAGAKVIRVIGNRRCVFQSGRPPLFTPPEPFTEMEIRYDNAYGGKDRKSNPENPFHFPSNDMGKGMVLKNKRELVEGLELPNLEDPRDLLTPEKTILDTPDMWPRQPMPQGLGWFQRMWYPRSFFAGSCPAYVDPGVVTKEEFLGYVQKDHIALSRAFKLPAFHTRFLQGASPGLYFPLLKGTETLRLKGLTPEGFLEFRLPGETPKLVLDIGFGAKSLDAVIHTVMIRAEDNQVDMVWRGSQPYPGIDWLPEMTTLVVEAD